jgi:Protein CHLORORESPIRATORY REDUCTION 7
MTDSLMFQEEDYVVLRAGAAEEICSAAEVVAELKHLLLENRDLDLPIDVTQKPPLDQASYLLSNYCELDLGNGRYIQWYAIRLEKS